MNIRYPDITAASIDMQVVQMRSWLHRLVDQLNRELTDAQPVAQSTNLAATTTTGTSPQGTFNSIKSLIIKSAEIVDAYYETISKRLEGEYVAQSEFGTYKENTANDIKASSTEISQVYTQVQTLAQLQRDTSAYIKTGKLYTDENGYDIYGVEVGQRTEDNGVEAFKQYARFTSGKLGFFDSNGIEVAYISKNKLDITNAEIKGELTRGGFVEKVLADKSVVRRWIGGTT